MARHTPETLLISGLVNSQDPTAHTAYGVVSEHMFGYRTEFDWIITFYDRFGRSPSRDEFLSQFADFPFSLDQDEIRWPATEVRRAFSARKLSRALIKASGALKSGDIEEAYAYFDDLQVHTVVEKPHNMINDPSFLDDYDVPEDRVAVPWPTLHAHTDGIGRGELWYFAARQGQGKSQMLLEIAADAALRGQTSILYSLEMTKRQVQIRMHAILAHKLGIKVSHHDMKRRQYDKLAYKQLLETLSTVPGEIHVHTPQDGPTTPAVVAARAGDYDLNIVDYTGLMKSNSGQPSSDDWRVLAGISNELKSAALATDSRIIAAAQINREGDSGFGRPPKLKHLSGSDALGQDGDVVITMSRYSQKASMFSIEKNRHGASGLYYFSRFDADAGDYTEISRDEADDIRDNEE